MPEERMKGNGSGRGAYIHSDRIALLHAGEVVLARGGSEAQAERVIEDARSTIHYHFPVEIEVRAAPDPIDPEEIINQTLHRLAARLENS